MNSNIDIEIKFERGNETGIWVVSIHKIQFLFWVGMKIGSEIWFNRRTGGKIAGLIYIIIEIVYVLEL